MPVEDVASELFLLNLTLEIKIGEIQRSFIQYKKKYNKQATMHTTFEFQSILQNYLHQQKMTLRWRLKVMRKSDGPTISRIRQQQASSNKSKICVRSLLFSDNENHRQVQLVNYLISSVPGHQKCTDYEGQTPAVTVHGLFLLAGARNKVPSLHMHTSLASG